MATFSPSVNANFHFLTIKFKSNKIRAQCLYSTVLPGQICGGLKSFLNNRLEYLIPKGTEEYYFTEVIQTHDWLAFNSTRIVR